MSETLTRNSAIRIERFAPETIDGVPTRRTDAFNLATSRGFHDGPPEADALKTLAEIAIADGVTFTAVHDDAAVAPSIHADQPVATYAAFPGTINVGGTRPVPVHQITSVTVSPTHRRRGILRTVMTEDLARAREAGMPLAALTASEATIYGRFGFGRVTEQQTLHLDVRGEVRFHAAPVGTTLQVPPPALAGIAPRVFEDFHASRRGSVGRQEAYLRHATGRWGQEGPDPDPKLRAAVYRDAAGEIRGYVTYAFAGWDAKPVTLTVRDLVATSEVARREIFRFLAAVDLVERVSHPFAAANDPLGWALEDPARISYTGREHALWVRVLDVPAAFAARAYRGSGTFTLRVADPQALAAGSYLFEVRDGRAAISPAADDSPFDLSCDAAALGPLLLGSCGVGELVSAGVLESSGRTPEAALAALLDLPGVPHAINGF